MKNLINALFPPREPSDCGLWAAYPEFGYWRCQEHGGIRYGDNVDLKYDRCCNAPSGLKDCWSLRLLKLCVFIYTTKKPRLMFQPFRGWRETKRRGIYAWMPHFRIWSIGICFYWWPGRVFGVQR